MKKTGSELKVERGVPIPGWSRPGTKTEMALIIEKMKPGDSVFFHDERMAKRFHATMTYINLNRTTGAAKRAMDGGFRVWLTAEKRTMQPRKSARK
jgi:hypothetical protein